MLNFYTVLFINLLLISGSFGASVKGRKIDDSKPISSHVNDLGKKMESPNTSFVDLQSPNFEEDLTVNLIPTNHETVSKSPPAATKKDATTPEGKTKFPLNISSKMAIAATTTTTTTTPKTVTDSTTTLPAIAKEVLSLEERATATGFPCPPAILLEPCLCTYVPATYVMFLNCRATTPGKFEQLLAKYFPGNKLSDFESTIANGQKFYENTTL